MLHVQESPYIKTIHYENADDFIKAISYKGELYNLFNEHFIFRGHSTDKYELIPSALRGNLVIDSITNIETASEDELNTVVFLASTELVQVEEEYKLLQDFYRACDTCGLYIPHIESLRNSFYPGVDAEILFQENKWIPQKYWELAALAQHHGVKTRLLDWTHDIFVALYFATTGVYNDPKESDPCKALKARMKGEIYPPKYNMEIWALNIDVVMAKPMKVPLRIIQPRYHSNDNLCAQKGMFTFWESFYPGLIDNEGKMKLNHEQKTDRRSLDEQLDSYLREIKAKERTYLYQISIPQDAANDIYSHIEKMGYNASTIFPGYYGVARFLKEHFEIHRKGK
jgi:hypothetical protein